MDVYSFKCHTAASCPIESHHMAAMALVSLRQHRTATWTLRSIIIVESWNRGCLNLCLQYNTMHMAQRYLRATALDVFWTGGKTPKVLEIQKVAVTWLKRSVQVSHNICTIGMNSKLANSFGWGSVAKYIVGNWYFIILIDINYKTRTSSVTTTFSHFSFLRRKYCWLMADNFRRLLKFSLGCQVFGINRNYHTAPGETSINVQLLLDGKFDPNKKTRPKVRIENAPMG